MFYIPLWILRIILSNSLAQIKKISFRAPSGISLNLEINLETIKIFILLSLPIHGQNYVTIPTIMLCYNNPTIQWFKTKQNNDWFSQMFWFAGEAAVAGVAHHHMTLLHLGLLPETALHSSHCPGTSRENTSWPSQGDGWTAGMPG